MSRKLSSRLRLAVSTVLLSLPAVSLAAPLPVTVPITANNQGVTFTQTSFHFDPNTPDNNTNIGMTSLSLSTFNTVTGNNFTTGYLNVVNANGGWVVQNLPVQTGMTIDTTSLNLGIANGVAANQANEQASVSNLPLAAAPNVGAFNFNLSNSVYDAKGENTGAVAPNMQPMPPANPAAPPPGGAAGNIAFVANALTNSAFETGVPNVQAADNQCGPAAIANGLTFLGQNGLVNPAINAPGRGALLTTVQLGLVPTPTTVDIPTLRNTPVYQAPDPRAAPLPPPENPVLTWAATTVLARTPGLAETTINNGNNTATYTSSEFAPLTPQGANDVNASLVGLIDTLANRISDNRAEFLYKQGLSSLAVIVDGNQGTSPQQQLYSAEAYLANYANAAARVNVSYQYDSFTQVTLADPGVAGIVPADKSLPNADGVNKNVSFGYIYQNIASNNMVVLGRTGHATDVVAAGQTLGQPWVVMQSDFQQTPDDPTDTNVNFGNGLEFSYLVLDANGTYTLPGVESDPQIQDDIVISVPEPTGMLVLVGVAVFFLTSRRFRAARA